MKATFQKGFTLIEVLVSLSILSTAIVGLSLTWSGNGARIRKSKLYNTVSVLLERKAVELELEYEGRSLSEIPEELSGDFGEDYPKYKWEFKAQEFIMPDLTALHSAGSDSPFTNETLIMVLGQMKEYLSNAVKEATITVILDNKGKETRFSVSTYFVDYNQTFSLGGGGEAGP